MEHITTGRDTTGRGRADLHPPGPRSRPCAHASDGAAPGSLLAGDPLAHDQALRDVLAVDGAVASG
jgi:hypothetical protein